jgi:hypothetical protein
MSSGSVFERDVIDEMGAEVGEVGECVGCGVGLEIPYTGNHGPAFHLREKFEVVDLELLHG